MNTPHALVVERNPVLRRALSSLLERRGYAVEAVARRSQALSAPSASSLMLLDDPAGERSYRLVRRGEEDLQVDLLVTGPDELVGELELVLG